MFRWNGEDLPTIGDVIRIIPTVTDDEAERFLNEYRDFCEAEGSPREVADQNIGYLSGYFGPDQAREIRERFGTPHPVFGMGSPSPEEALEAGQRVALGEFPDTFGDNS